LHILYKLFYINALTALQPQGKKKYN